MLMENELKLDHHIHVSFNYRSCCVFHSDIDALLWQYEDRND